MNASLIIFITINLFALVYLIEALRRVRKKIKEFPLTEDRTTLPWGFIRLRHVVILYVITYLVWVVLSVMLYAYFIDSNFSLY